MKSPSQLQHERIDAMPIEELARKLYTERLRRYGFQASWLAVGFDWRLRQDSAGMFIPVTLGTGNWMNELIAGGTFTDEKFYQGHYYSNDYRPIRSLRESVVRWSLQMVLHTPQGLEKRILECDLDGFNADYRQGIGVTLAHGFMCLKHKMTSRGTKLRDAAKWLVDHRNVVI